FAADFGGLRAHGSYEALLADPEVTAVYIATPHPSHLEWTRRAAAAGKHILCEKPLALNRAGAQQMVDAARAHQVFLMEAFMYRCHPQTAKLAELVRDGAIGELRAIHANFTVPFKFDPAHRIFNKALGGGAILDLGCYPVSFSRRMAGAAAGRAFAEPLSFHGSGRLNTVTGADEFAAATVAYPGGITAQLSCSSCTPLEIRTRLLGSAGWIDVPSPFHPGEPNKPAVITLHRPGGAAPEKMEFANAQPLYALEADTVGDAIARGELESPAMSHADTLGNMAVLDAWRAAVGMRYDGEG
ncbi:MAG: Gfo/Idh/MocA family oxidoreductase, partial [bacterium]|nr:Gfo/Idh/MocA family oxidoreductase [bacterium]